MYSLVKTTLIALLCSVAMVAAAAGTTGPSDATTAPPTHASDVGQVLCFGSTINLKGPVDGGSSYKKYQWYKLDASGNKQLVKEGTDNSYTETSDGAGYYTYQLVTVNTNDCSSDISDPFKVYVLPQMNPTITSVGNVSTVCEKGQSTITLTADGGNTNFTYTYQWTRNGTDIAGATSNTYAVTEQNSGSVNYGVKVSYTLNNGCSQTASQTINVIPVPTKPVIVAGP